MTIATTSEAAGMSADRLRRIRPFMQEYVDRGKLAGVTTLIARQGEVVHFESVGMAHIEANAPMRDDTIVRIYSMTKPITSVAWTELRMERCAGRQDVSGGGATRGDAGGDGV